jgi:hypothetical protein
MKGDFSMKETKRLLIERNGTVCMLCGKDVGRRITWHHIKPRCVGGDNSYQNGSLLCERCHFQRVNKLKYGTREYRELMEEIKRNKK